MKPLTALLLPLLLLCLVFTALDVDQAAAQCTYTYTWTFDSAVTEWTLDTGSTLTHSLADGHTAAGMMTVGGNAYSTIKLTKGDLLTALGLPTDSNILANGVTFTAWSKLGAGSDYSRLFLMQQNADQTSNYTTYNTWGSLSLPGTRNENIAWFGLQTIAALSTHTAYWDDITITIPCGNVNTGTPAPTETATPMIPPTATPTISETIGIVMPGDGAYITASIPGPLPMPSIDNTIDLDVFWDMNNFIAIIQIVQTFFYFENIPEFLKIFIFVMSIVIGLRIIIAIISTRAAARREARKEV